MQTLQDFWNRLTGSTTSQPTTEVVSNASGTVPGNTTEGVPVGGKKRKYKKTRRVNKKSRRSRPSRK